MISAGVALSEEEIPDSIITYWAKYDIPLEEYVQLGYGMSEPEDAHSSEWCPQQPSTISLTYADHPICDRLLDEMRRLGRIK